MSTRSWSSVVALGAVALGFLALQVVVVSPRVFYSWDEALYLSQFARGVPPFFMGAPRAWGLPLLVAPVVTVTSSLVVLRGYLMVLSSLGLFAAFLPWIRIVGAGRAAAAAAFFGTLWLTLFYANEAMPNVLVAECAILTVGAYCVESRGYGGALIAALGIASLIRPTDTVWIVVPLVTDTLLRRKLLRLGPVVIGLAIGWLPWIIESYLRFGSPTQRMQEINDINGAQGSLWSLTIPLRNLQALSSGDLICFWGTPDCGAVTWTGILLWSLLPPLALLGLWSLRGSAAFRPALLAFGTATASAVPYLLAVRQVNPRYLLTSYALLGIPAMAALFRMAAPQRSTSHRTAGIVAVAVLVGWHLTSQLSMARSVAAREYQGTGEIAASADLLRPSVVRPPCVLGGDHLSEFAYALHCDVRWDALDKRGDACVLLPLEARHVTVAFVRSPAQPRPPRWGWNRMALAPAWYAYIPTPKAFRHCAKAHKPKGVRGRAGDRRHGRSPSRRQAGRSAR